MYFFISIDDPTSIIIRKMLIMLMQRIMLTALLTPMPVFWKFNEKIHNKYERGQDFICKVVVDPLSQLI